MYRIHFDYKTARFVVQVLRCGLVWRSAEGLDYGTYDEATSAVTAIGLDKLYANKSHDKFRAYMRAVQA